MAIPMADEEDEEEWELMHDQYSRLYRYIIFPSVHARNNQRCECEECNALFVIHLDAQIA